MCVTEPSQVRLLKKLVRWGKVETTYEQMVYSEATIAMPLVAGFAYHKGAWKNRTKKEMQKIFNKKDVTV